ncbi:MAG: adenylyltransferase/cytidyltransferase family protein [Quadrisphaera sp.]
MSVIGYVPGVYDMFHIGHLNILRSAREGCDVLIAGAVTDDVVERTKGKRPVVPLTERMEILGSIGIVDKVVADDCGSDKLPMWQRIHFDVLFKGDDWKGTPKGDQLEASMAAVGAQVVYFPYTETTSSSMLRELITAHG